MSILLAGANGQLGTALRAVLPHVVPTDKETLDISNARQVRAFVEEHKPTCIINAAAYTAVDKAEEEPAASFRINAVGAGNLAIAAQGIGIPIIHISTDYVFDGLAGQPYRPGDYTNPVSVYGKSKLAGEYMVSSLNPQHYILRTAWLYGHDKPNFVSKMLERAKTMDKVRVVDDQVGCPTYVPHLVEVILQMVKDIRYGMYENKMPVPGIYHVAGSGQASWYELTRYVFDSLGIQTKVEPIETHEFPTPARRPVYAPLVSRPPYALPHWKRGVEQYVERITNG
jgi:dTDP-4-dehydrorhamnose reductase